jgi:hypothetical protein
MKLKLPGLAMTAATALTATTVVTTHPQVAQAACLSASSCQVTITNGGTANGTYDITTISSTFNDSASILSSEPWFGNLGLALEFASVVGDGLGFPNTLQALVGGIPTQLESAPYFAYFLGIDPDSPVGLFGFSTLTDVNERGIFQFLGSPVDQPFVFASATRVESVPEPHETAGLLASGFLGLGFASIRRKRHLASSIKAQ